MSAGPARAAVPVLAILVLAALLGWYFHGRQQPSAPPAPSGGQTASRAMGEAPAIRRPETVKPGQDPAPPAGEAPAPATGASPRPEPAGPAAGSGSASNAQASNVQTAPERPPAGPVAENKPAESAAGPSFDVVRVEPSGETVIAGRAGPGATVDLMRNGESMARVVADASGLFAIVPPALAPGPHEIVLQSITPDGTRLRSGQSVTVVIGERRDQRPLVTVTAPDQPTVVLSRPDPVPPPGTPPAPPVATATRDAQTAPAAAAPPPAPPAPRPPIRIAIVESEGEGRLFVSGQASPGATVRLYLNDAFVAPGGTGPDGRLSFSIERGIRPGDYRVRLDDVDPVTGAVKSRAEVAFNVPAPTSAPLVASNQPPGRSVTDEPARNERARVPERRESPPGSLPSAGPDGLSRPPSRNTAVVPSTSGPTTSGPVTSGPSTPGPAAGAPTISGPATSGSATSGPATSGPATSAPTMSGSPPGAAAPSQAGRSRPAGNAGSTASTAVLVSTDPGQVIVPEVSTAIVARGDNLWRISKRIYGRGLRYTVIFDANTPQIRNPDLIYPGQVFVLPPGAQSDIR